MFVFVVMPFKDDLTRSYNEVIKPTLEAEGCIVKRADEFTSHQNILKDIISGIFNADLIIADLTEHNPNVYYELGVAHSLNKPAILLTRDIKNLPFDLASYRTVPYSDSLPDTANLVNTLQITVREIKEGKGEFGNPVSDHLPGLKISIETNIKRDEVVLTAKDIMDYSKEAETALYEIVYSAGRQSSLLSALTNSINLSTKLVEYAKSTKSQALFERSALELDKELEKYGDGVAKELPSFKGYWETVKNRFITLLTTLPIVTMQDIETLKFVKSQLENLSREIERLIPTIKEHSSTLGKFNEKQKDLHPSVGKVQAILDEQYEIYYIGNAYIARMINMIDRKLSEVE